MTRDRSDGIDLTWKSGVKYHRLLLEPNHDGTWTRIEQVRHAHGDSWRTRGQDTVEQVRVDVPPATSNAGP